MPPAGQKLLAFSLEERMKDCEEAEEGSASRRCFPIVVPC